LLIPADIHDAMVAHCLMDAPLECCGLLGGAGTEVSLFYPLANDEASETSYNAEPHELIRAVQDLRAREGEILAIYHSHPRWTAVPSKADLARNHFGDVPRIIVSLLEHPPEVRVWRLGDAAFEELPWRLVRWPASGRVRVRVSLRLNRPRRDVRLAGPASSKGQNGQRLRSTRHPAKVGSSMQRTLIIFKHDCVQRRLVGEILGRFEAKGLRIAALKTIRVDRALGEKHYAEHQGKPFFDGLIAFITGGPVVVGVLEGNEAIAVVRAMLGATNGVAAAPGTIRGDFSISKQNNLVHGSDSPESAQREIALWFRPEEVVEYTIEGSRWVFDGA
jgi:nucleoside-diphosphate kinase